MLDFTIKTDKKNGKKYTKTSISGKPLLNTPQLNKGTAFTAQERIDFNLHGKLPPHIETLRQQANRAYKQFQSYKNALQQNRYLMNMHDKNEVLFYKLLEMHLSEMMPIIYTPTIGLAVQEFSREFRQPRGLYISYPDINNIEEILKNRSNPEIDLIVVTDGEGVLGIGDQGIGAMDIPIGKLAVYTACGNINPLRTLPILLDVGTNNKQLLDDPLYLGWRHKRLQAKEYDKFIAAFITVVKKIFPKVFLHWEDFGRDNAHKNLTLYRNKICSFNDDIQGTAIVTLAAVMAGVKAKKDKLSDQRIVVFGAGTAGTGIAQQIVTAMCRKGLTKDEAYKRFWLIDKPGLLTEYISGLTSEQLPFIRTKQELKSWKIAQKKNITLFEVIKNIKPTILIGCSGLHGAFNKKSVQEMAKHVKHPIILPLSNPTERSEAKPQDLINWTENKALIATGSPFPAARYKTKKITIAQCNNALAFPGLGLGVIATKAKTISNDTLWQACKILYKSAPILQDFNKPLLPEIINAKKIANKIAVAVVKQIIAEKSATNVGDPKELIKTIAWHPEYLPYRKK